MEFLPQSIDFSDGLFFYIFNILYNIKKIIGL